MRRQLCSPLAKPPSDSADGISSDSFRDPMTHVAKRTLGCALLCLSFVAPDTYAQIRSGTITGLVTDPNGAVVAGADVTVQNSGTHQASSIRTTGTGLFTVPSRDKHDLDPLLREFAAAKRRPRGDFHMAQLILNPTLEGFDIHERRRRAPMMKSKDALSVVGTFSMTVEVMK